MSSQQTCTIIIFDCLGADRPQLRLILKVGGASTPDLVDHGDSSSGMSNRQGAANVHYGEEDSHQSSMFSLPEGSEREKHKKKKEKKKKKNKEKDRDKEKDKDRKKHKHKVLD